MKRKFIVPFVVVEMCLMSLTATTSNHGAMRETENDLVNHPVKISVVEMKPFFMRRWLGDTNSTRSISSVTDAVNSSIVSDDVEFSGFIVDVVQQLSREIPFQFRWLVDTARTGRRRTTDSMPVRRLLAAEADVAVVGLLPDEFDDVRLMKSRAILRTSLTLLTSRRRRHGMTLRHVTDDASLTPGVIAHSRVERLLRRSRQPAQRLLWRRISGRASKTTRDRSRTRQSRRRGRRVTSSSSRVVTLDVGVSRVLNSASNDNNSDFTLIVESTDAAYVSTRRPGCGLTVVHLNTPVAEYRLVVAADTVNSSLLLWQRRLLQRLDSALAALQQAAIIKRLYYKWWTSTDCLVHITDPDIWTQSIDSDAADVDETSDDERIFVESPVSAGRANRPVVSTQDDGDDLDRGEAETVSDVSQRQVRDPIHVTTTAVSKDATVDNSHNSHQHEQSDSDVSPSMTTLSVTTVETTTRPSTTTLTTSSRNTRTTATTTTLRRRSYRKQDNNDTDGGRLSANADQNLQSYDDLRASASAENTSDDRVFVTHRALTAVHADEDHDVVSFDDDDDDDVRSRDVVVSEQELTVKQQWRRGSAAVLHAAGDVIQSVATTTTTADRGASSVTADGGDVVSPASVTLLLMMVTTSLLGINDVSSHLL